MCIDIQNFHGPEEKISLSCQYSLLKKNSKESTCLPVIYK